MGNSRIKYTTIKSPKKPNFEPTQTETTPPINLELKRAKWVPGNSAIQGLWGLWWGSCIGGWWLWWWGVELRGFDEREGLREGLGRIEERRWGWLWLWALNNFLVRWYLYHCWGRGALVPLVLVLLWVLLTFLFLILHFFFFFLFLRLLQRDTTSGSVYQTWAGPFDGDDFISHRNPTHYVWIV